MAKEKLPTSKKVLMSGKAVELHGIPKVIPYNTNNAWGFGGGIGDELKFPDGYRIRIGTAYFRHLNSEKYTNFFNPKGKQISADEFYTKDISE